MSRGPKITIYYPKLIRMANPIVERSINQEIVNETIKLANHHYGNGTTTPRVEEMIGHFEIKNNQRDILSLSLSNYVYYAQAAHGMTVITSLTSNKQTGRKYQLQDLFKKGTDYVSRINTEIKKQIKKREIPIINEFTTIHPNQDYYIADRTLVIYFQLYELTPYVFGFPMFPISIYDLQDIIDENGPLGRMIENN